MSSKQLILQNENHPTGNSTALKRKTSVKKTGTKKTDAFADRPRERLLKYGAKQLDNASLISILLGTGYDADQDVLALSHRLLKYLGNLSQLNTKKLEDLLTIKGIGPAKASRLLAIAELAIRITGKNENNPNETSNALDGTLSSLSYLQLFGHYVRTTNQYTLPLIIACQIDHSFISQSSLPIEQTQQEAQIQKALDLSVTLSLSALVTDHSQHSRWLARLLMQESDTQNSWILISYREQESLSADEIDRIHSLLDLAKIMSVHLHEVIIVSPNNQWSITHNYKG